MNMLSHFKESLSEHSVYGELANQNHPIEDRAVLYYAIIHFERFNRYGGDCVDWNSYFGNPNSERNASASIDAKA